MHAATIRILAASLTITVAGALGVAVAPAAVALEGNQGVRVMPLGDSITDGLTTPGGYRIPLLQSLTTGGYQVDYVGGNYNGPPTLADHDNEGHSGWRIDELATNIDAWLTAYQPRTVLLHIGTNDVAQNYQLSTAAARLSALVDRIVAADPNVELFVATLIPLADPTLQARSDTYLNPQIPGIVSAKAATGAHVHLVDMRSALTAADLADGVHPNPGGYLKMANVWYSALTSNPASLQRPTVPVNQTISLQATTPGYTAWYARHRNSLGYISSVTSASSATDKADASWIIRTGLADSRCYSFESKNYPGYFLRHANYRVQLGFNDGSGALAADATWCLSGGAGGYRLTAWNYQGSFLRHGQGELWLATLAGPNWWDYAGSFREDSTFAFVAPWAP